MLNDRMKTLTGSPALAGSATSPQRFDTEHTHPLGQPSVPHSRQDSRRYLAVGSMDTSLTLPSSAVSEEGLAPASLRFRPFLHDHQHSSLLAQRHSSSLVLGNTRRS